MEPRERKERSAYPNGPKVSVASVDDDSNVIGQEFNLDATNDDTYFEGGGLQFDDEAPSTEDIENEKQEIEKMTDEEIKVKALGQAVNVAKLMSNVGVDDVIEIAKKLAKFIKGQ